MSRFHPFQTGLVYKILDGDLFILTLKVPGYKKLYIRSGRAVKLGERLFTPREILEKAMVSRIQYRQTALCIINKIYFRSILDVWKP